MSSQGHEAQGMKTTAGRLPDSPGGRKECVSLLRLKDTHQAQTRTSLLDAAISVTAFRGGKHRRGLKQHHLLLAPVIHQHHGKTHQALRAGGRGHALELSVKGQDAGFANAAFTLIAERKVIDHQGFVPDAFNKMGLILDMPVGADMPIVGGQQLFKGWHVCGHDSFGIQFCGIDPGSGWGSKTEQTEQQGDEIFHANLHMVGKP